MAPESETTGLVEVGAGEYKSGRWGRVVAVLQGCRKGHFRGLLLEDHHPLAKSSWSARTGSGMPVGT